LHPVARAPVDLVGLRRPLVVRRQVVRDLEVSVVRLRKVDPVALVVRLRKADSAVRRPIHLEDPPPGEGVALVARLRQEITVRRLRKVVEATARRLQEAPAVTVVRRKVVRRQVNKATVVRRRKISISR
jgi:hypothetical protein